MQDRRSYISDGNQVGGSLIVDSRVAAGMSLLSGDASLAG
jgi:hypothetical protein